MIAGKSRILAAPICLALALGLSGCAGILRDRIFQPVPLAQTPIAWQGTAPETVTAVTQDGLELAGYYWAPRTPGGDIIVYFQGNGANHRVGAARAQPFTRDGQGVLVASYRGYGDNPGSPSEAGLARDADAWITAAQTLAPGSRRFLFGHSLGGAVALSAAGRHRVAGVATLGTFSSMTAMVPGIARGVLRDRFDSIRAIGQVAAPVWLYHGTKDRIVPFAMAEQLRAAAPAGRVTVVPLEDGDHHVPMDKLAPLVWQNFAAAPPPGS